MSEQRAPRVVPLPPSQWTASHRDLLARFAPDGLVDPLLAALLHMPEMAEAVMPMTRYVIEASTLSPSHRLALALRTAALDRSDTVWATYAARGTSQHAEVIPLAFGRADDGDQVGQSLLRLADELVLTASVSEETWASLADGHDVTWLIDAVETVAHVSFLCCLARSFGVPADSPELAESLVARPSGPDRHAVARRQPLLAAARIEPVAGEELAVLRTFARHPAIDAARRPRSAFVNQVSPLSPHDRETLILRIGWDCGSEYEWAKHVGGVGRARDHGVDPMLVAADPTATGVSDHDALLMRVADELHRDSSVSDPTWAALLGRYDLVGAMCAVFTASSYRSTSMSLNAYGVQLEPGDEGFPPDGG